MAFHATRATSSSVVSKVWGSSSWDAGTLWICVPAGTGASVGAPSASSTVKAT